MAIKRNNEVMISPHADDMILENDSCSSWTKTGYRKVGKNSIIAL